MKKIKILYTIPNFDTAGSGRVVYDLVKHLDKEKFAPEICCFHNRGAFFKEIEKLNVPIHIFKFTTEYKPAISFLFRVWKISRFLKKNDFDLIHSWHWSSDFSEPLAAKLAGIPFVYTKKAMGWGNKAWVWRSKLSTKIIAINQDMVHDFFTKMQDKVVKLPLGVDTTVFNPQEKDTILYKHLDLHENDFVIVSVVNMVHVKGIEILLDAVQKMKDSTVKVFLIGNDKSDYVDSLKKKYAEKQFTFVGKQLDVKAYLSLANIFVIPTKDEGRKEGMPIAPLEAMAMGIPVIGSNISGIKDILEDYPSHLFKASDVNDLYKKLEEFKVNAPFDSEKLVAMVQEKFSLHSFIKQRELLYQDLVNK